MTYFLLFPKSPAYADVKRPGGGDFRDSFWDGFSDRSAYLNKIRSLREGISSLDLTQYSASADVYAKVQYDDESVNKSNRPSKVWEKSNLEVIASSPDNSYVLSGKRKDFEKLSRYIDRASFEEAKSGENIQRTEKNIFRELYACQLFSDVNVSISDRLDPRILENFESRGTQAFNAIIVLYQDVEFSRHDELYSLLRGKIPQGFELTQRDSEIYEYTGSLSYEAKISLAVVRELLSDPTLNFIRMIRLENEFEANRSHPVMNVNELNILSPLTDLVVGVFDSGVESSLMDPYCFHSESHLGHEPVDTEHGTFVTSRLLFGDNMFDAIESGSSLQPIGRYLDIQVLHYDPSSGKTKVKETVLGTAIAKTVKRYADSDTPVYIYNLSVGDSLKLSHSDWSELTALIDNVARKHDVIIVVAAGNHELFPSAEYNDLYDDRTLSVDIGSPADALNVLTVGSISAKADTDTICPEVGLPAPFTRRSFLESNHIKPEFVANGGNVQRCNEREYNPSFLEASMNKYGVDGLTANDYKRDVGTSFSAPLIARQVAEMFGVIRESNFFDNVNIEGNRLNLAKTLLAHSTFFGDHPPIESEGLRKAYGFGSPDFSRLLNGREDLAHIVYADRLEYANRKHKLRFLVPDEYLDKTLNICFTLAYNPPVDFSYAEYKMNTLMASVRFVDVNSETGEINERKKPKYPSIDWKDPGNQKLEDFNMIQFRGRIKNPYPLLEVVLQMTVYEEYVKKHLGNTHEIYQDYSLMVTLEDPDGGALWQNIINTGQFEVMQAVQAGVTVEN